MKKNFLFVMAAAAMLASCSKDAAVSEPAGNGNENGVVDPTNPNSPVKIVLGASTIDAGVELDKKASRAPIDAWNNTVVGIYALADAGEDWSTAVVNDPTMLWENVKGTIESGTTDQAIILELNDQPGYYPNQGTNEYTFYGYYPYQEEAPTMEGKKVTTTYTITGEEDILCGKAAVEDGYNASYFRTGEGATPIITFNHMLTQLKFTVKKSESFDDGQQLSIQSITISDVPTQLDLVIANGDDSSQSIAQNADPVTTSLPVSNASFDITANANSTTAENVGQPIMLFSDNAATNSFKAIVVLVDGAGKTSSNEITLNAPAPDNIYKQGSAYTVELTINSLQEITVKASLTAWANGGTISGTI